MKGIVTGNSVNFAEACTLMEQQLGHDTVIALATSGNGQAGVRNVDGYYKDGSIYITANGESTKMKHISISPNVAFCVSFDPARPHYEALLEGFGKAYSIGNLLDPKNREIRNMLRVVFSSFYDRDVEEDNPKTCIIKLDVFWAVIFDGRYKYIMNFDDKTSEKQDCVI